MNILGKLFSLPARLRRAPLWQREPIRAGKNPQPRTILVSGGTGFIGRHLCRWLIEHGERVIVLTRRLGVAQNLYGPHAEIVTALEQIPATRRIDVAVNLAGARILGLPWTGARRKELVQSRLRVTNALAALIARLDSKPELLINASAIGYYGVRGDEKITETARGQPIFQSHLCQVWELAAQAAEQYGVRVCRLRFGLVLGRDGGAFPGLVRAARFRTRLVLGSGAQWVSWIHIDDVLRLIDFCIENRDLDGGINATAPQPLRQTTFAVMLAAQFGRFVQLRVPASVLRLALGEAAQLLVDGQRVLPVKARAAGFSFRYSSFETALDGLFATDDSPRMPAAIM
ncbi:MAG: TIGR01777 family oxidoreductase [Steroidobacteraceae bacterium]